MCMGTPVQYEQTIGELVYGPVRRLEHKLSAGGPDNAARCTSLRQRVKELKDELELARSEAAISKEGRCG